MMFLTLASFHMCCLAAAGFLSVAAPQVLAIHWEKWCESNFLLHKVKCHKMQFYQQV